MSTTNISECLGDWLFEDDRSCFGLRFLANGEGIMFALEKGGSSIGRYFAYVIESDEIALIAFWDHGGPSEKLETPVKFQYRRTTDCLVAAEGLVLSRRAWPWPISDD